MKTNRADEYVTSIRVRSKVKKDFELLAIKEGYSSWSDKVRAMMLEEVQKNKNKYKLIDSYSEHV